MKLKLFIILVLCAVLLAGCACEHEWNAANCTTPKTCALCEETEGDPLGHTWTVATCTAPKTCVTCNATEGAALGHTWTEATCTAPKTCSVCNAVEGAALGHTWTDATCTSPKTCSVCSATEGDVLEHTFGEWTVIDSETEERTCTACGYAEQQEIDRQAQLMSYLVISAWDLEGFVVEEEYLPLSMIEDPDYWDCSFCFGNDGSITLTFLTGEEYSFVMSSAYFDYSADEGFETYACILEDEEYYYTTILFVYEDGTCELWCQLDADWWIFMLKQ